MLRGASPRGCRLYRSPTDVCPECRKELAAITHATRRKRLAKGMCGECGDRLAKRGTHRGKPYTSCDRCLARKRGQMQALRISRKSVRVRIIPTIVSSPSDVWLPPDDKGDIGE